MGEKGKLLDMGNDTVQAVESSGEKAPLLQHSTESPPRKTSLFGAVFIVINAALGAGLLAFPFAFNSAGGWGWGLLIEAVLLGFIVFGLLVLAWLAERGETTTYEATIGSVLGPRVKAIVEVCIAIYCFGTCITFLVVIGDQIDSITSAFHYKNESLAVQWWVDRRFTITVSSVLLILPWMWLRNMGVLSYTSFLGVLCCVYIAFVVTVKFFTLDKADLPVVTDTCSRSWPDSFNAVPFICFGYQCHISSVPIYAGLKRRSVRKFSYVLAVGLTICVLVYSFTGIFGFLTFHGHRCISSDILKNYCPGDIPIDVARAMLAIVIITSYPILAFCGRTAADSLVMRAMRLCRADKFLQQHEAARFRVEGTIWFFLSLLLALFVPAISYVINPIGGLAAVFIFVFPGMSILSVSTSVHSTKFGRWKRRWLIVAGAVVIVLGTFIFGNSITYSLLQDVGIIKD